VTIIEKQPRRKKADWLSAALVALRTEGIAGVRVERLARDLNVAKSGFYWHFENRDRLYEDLLEHWEHEFTDAVTVNAELDGLPPADRLLRATQMIWEHDLGGYDFAFQAWAQGNPEILARVNRVYGKRLSWVRKTFRELGFKGTDLEMRARLFVAYHSWERTTFPEQSAAHARRLMKKRIEFLVRP
jgi:AcrR family transcriptional regulator